jgi:hypothetical protein
MLRLLLPGSDVPVIVVTARDEMSSHPTLSGLIWRRDRWCGSPDGEPHRDPVLGGIRPDPGLTAAAAPSHPQRGRSLTPERHVFNPQKGTS